MKKINEFKDRLKKAIEKREMTAADLSKKTNIHEANISHYLKGSYEAKQDKLYLLSKALKVDVAWLMGYDVPMDLKTPTTTSINNNKKNMIKMPVLGRIPAGVPFDAIEDIETYLSIPKDRVKESPENYFLLRIDGDSMFPDYKDKDVVLFEKASTADNGQNVAIMVNGYDATFKTIFRYDDRIELKPINQQYQVQVFNNKEIEELPITILGIAKYLYRDLE